MTILIVEDDPVQVKCLGKIIQEVSDSIRIIRAFTASKAFEIANNEQIDLFYIDIELPDYSGIELALKLRNVKKYKLTWIIFITVHIDYILQAFKKVHCYDYISKPYDKKLIQNITELLLKDIQEDNLSTEQRKCLILHKNSNVLKIYTDEIIFIEVYLRTCILHTIRGKYEMNYISLKEIIRLNKDDLLIQSHRSYIINLRYIEEISKTKTTWVAQFQNYDERAYIGPQYKEKVFKYFKKYNEVGVVI